MAWHVNPAAATRDEVNPVAVVDYEPKVLIKSYWAN
jgi:hypothetical protein